MYGMADVDYYPLILRAVLRLPTNHHDARQDLYAHARKTLAAQPLPKWRIKRELRALNSAIHEVEKSPHEIPGARGSTAALILSIFFLKVLWILDATSMSLPWVVRPWN